jgi:hypothetical protein
MAPRDEDGVVEAVQGSGQPEGQKQPADPVALACRDHRADGGVARNQEDVGIEVFCGAEAAEQHGVVGQLERNGRHLQGHGQRPQRPGKPPSGPRGHGPARWPRSATQHAGALGGVGWSIRWHLYLLRGRCPRGAARRHARRGPSRDRYGLRHHMSCLGGDTASQVSNQLSDGPLGASLARKDLLTALPIDVPLVDG